MFNPTLRLPAPLSRANPRRVSIQALLHWAFGIEFASLDFDELGTLAGKGLGGSSPLYRLMQGGQLGCQIDGGGRSYPHHDAELVVSAVSALSVAHGGQAMASRIAELARADRRPDWMPNAQPRIWPMATYLNQHGETSKTGHAATLGVHGWPDQPRLNRKGVTVYDKVLFTPCVWTPSAEGIAAKRRWYLAWWGALLDIRGTLQVGAGLECHVVSDRMPDMQPWKNVDNEKEDH
ncbi:MAG: hypothetical protein JKY94_08110 [Rhodobacteraceae bacterium]|nr:hypothetical protein [Paracoccaceae bacterium]